MEQLCYNPSIKEHLTGEGYLGLKEILKKMLNALRYRICVVQSLMSTNNLQGCTKKQVIDHCLVAELPNISQSGVVIHLRCGTIYGFVYRSIYYHSRVLHI